MSEIRGSLYTTVTALWEDILYTVTYAAGDGSGTMSSGEAHAGKPFTLPENGFTAPDGMKFRSWSIDGIAYAPRSTITFSSDSTATAIWEDIDTPKDRYSVSFNANGGSGAMQSLSVIEGDALILPSNEFEAPDGKRFKAWSINEIEYSPGMGVTLTADTTVKALWESIDAAFTVTYDANGGSGLMRDEIVSLGETLILPNSGFTAPNGMIFRAWDVDGVEYQPDAEIAINADTTVKAIWTAITYTVTFDSVGGSNVDSQIIESGNLAFKPQNPTKKNFTFSNWYVDADYTAVYNFNAPVNENFTLYAKWNQRSQGCYVATAVYGSYDCPEVWTLRRFRDRVLAKTWYGRLFIKLYYAISPTAVRLFGETRWFQDFWRIKLDKMVNTLHEKGFESTPYNDQIW